MCFAIPFQVVSTNGNQATIENGKTVFIGPELQVLPGDYVRITGDVVVEQLSQEQGHKIRTLIKELNAA